MDIPDFQGVNQIIEVSSTGREAMSEKVLKLAERQDM